MRIDEYFANRVHAIERCPAISAKNVTLAAIGERIPVFPIG